ncbi:fimbrial protein [Klebsiella sp. CN_Kp098]|uniref:fimbrial protein n=1 Tax=unclassified Klebsiella TaxID=2608929 RepID=UPI0032B4FB77
MTHILRSAALLLCCTSMPVLSDPTPTYPMVVGVLEMSGQITAPACVLDTGSASQAVIMGAVSSNDFSGAGSDGAPVPFFLQLDNCETSTEQLARISLRGDIDAHNPQLLRTYSDSSAVAMGVGIAIFDASNHLLIPDGSDMSQARLQDGVTRIGFTARYRATLPEVSGGEANAIAWFTVNYQ